MESSYFPEFPKDDYALAVLTQAAAIHESSDNNITSTGIRRSNRRSNSGFLAEHPSTSSNNSIDFQESNPFLISKQQQHTERSINLRTEQSSSGNSLGGGGHNQVERGVTSQSTGDEMRNSRKAGTQAYNPLLAQHGQQYAHGSFDDMRGQVSQDFGILSAETYDDGRGNLRPKDLAIISRKHPSEMPFGMVDEQAFGEVGSEEYEGNRRNRKKQRIDSDDDEARKKTRGRPRVDTRDETAADVCV